MWDRQEGEAARALVPEMWTLEKWKVVEDGGGEFPCVVGLGGWTGVL